MTAGPLSLGGTFEEVRELLTTPFVTDEFRQESLRRQNAQIELLTALVEGTVGQPSPPLVGGVGDGIAFPPAAASSLTQMAIRATDFEQSETRDTVTIAPGDEQVVVAFEPSDAALWYETGTSDETFSTYQYRVDGNEILEEPQFEPLGLYNDPFQFPQPLIVFNFVEVVVGRDSDAAGSADYFSKVRTVPITDNTAEGLQLAWDRV